MSYNLKTYCFLLFICLSVASIKGQPAENVSGKIKGKSPNGNWHFQMVMQNNSQKYQAMKKNMLGILSVITSVPVVNAPKGFDVDPFLSISSDLNSSSPNGDYTPVRASFDLSCFNYHKNESSGKILRAEESHSGMNVIANDLSSFYGNTFKQDCMDTKTVFFFTGFPVDSSNKNYLIIKNSRVLRKNLKTLFVSVTKNEYLRFLIKKENLIKQNFQNNLEDLNNLKNLNSPDADKAVKQNEKYISSVNLLINQYNSELSASEKDNKNEPSYVENLLNDNKLSADQSVYEYPYQLVTQQSKNSTALWKINPDYFDTSLPESSVQVLILNYHSSNFCPPFMKQRLKDWFHQIDYSKLDNLISK